MVVYLITNLVNSKIYVGQTTRSLEERMLEHFKYHVRYRSALAAAIKKYGADNFRVDVLQEASSVEELNKMEEEWIEKLGAMGPGGYNLKSGGLNNTPSAETRRKLSVAGRGKKRGADFIKKLIERNQKEIFRYDLDGAYLDSFESAKKAARAVGIDVSSVCAAARGNKKTAAGFRWSYSRHISLPHVAPRAPSSAESRRSAAEKVSRPVVVTKDGQTRMFPSVTEASVFTGVDKSTVSKCCRRPGWTGKGHTFRYG